MNYNFKFEVGSKRFGSFPAALIESLGKEKEISIPDQTITAEFSSIEELVGDIMRNRCQKFEVVEAFLDGTTSSLSAFNNKSLAYWVMNHVSKIVDCWYQFKRQGGSTYVVEMQTSEDARVFYLKEIE